MPTVTATTRTVPARELSRGDVVLFMGTRSTVLQSYPHMVDGAAFRRVLFEAEGGAIGARRVWANLYPATPVKVLS